MADEQQEIIKCSGCKKKFHLDGFKVNRLGVRQKSCLECSARRKKKNDTNRCEHGKVKHNCVDCGGSQICAHKLQKWACKDCKGGRFCIHGKQKIMCADCDGRALCEHSEYKYACIICSKKAEEPKEE